MRPPGRSAPRPFTARRGALRRCDDTTVGGRGDRGAATVLVVSAIGVLAFVGLALAGVASLVVAQRQAQSAADLAALAGAVAAADAADGCAAAAGAASANAARLVSCVTGGGDVRVRVSVRGPVLAGRSYDVTAESRAGPA